MSPWLSSLLRIAVLVAAFVVAAWLMSSDDQRRRLLVAFGIADSIEQAEATALVLVGPGFEIELLPALDAAMGPMRYRAVRPDPDPSMAAATPAGRAARPGEAAGRAVAHGDDPCAFGRAANPSRARPAPRVYQWTDDAGRPVFSDHAVGVDARLVDTETDSGVGRFSATYDYDGFTPPTGFQQQLAIDIDGVFHFLADDLGLGAVEPVHVNLAIIANEGRFAADAARARLGTAGISGYYRYLDNRAVVRWDGAESTRAVARHEIVHLALGNWLGDLPLWLNEGLAEFVERMTFTQSFATSAASPRTLERLRRLARRGTLPELRGFLAADRGDWNRWGSDLAYPYAWSLVYFMLQEPARARTLSDLLRAQAGHRCQVFDDIGWLDGHYPGGLDALARDWRRWLDGGVAAQLQF